MSFKLEIKLQEEAASKNQPHKFELTSWGVFHDFHPFQ